MRTFVEAAFQRESFHCPHCGVFAHQTWGDLLWRSTEDQEEALSGWAACICQSCKQISLWSESQLVYPSRGAVRPPHTDMPEDLKRDYEEAAAIVMRSPRGAAALLRLCVQKLCVHLGKDGSNLNSAIAKLVQEGLHPHVQMALDILRVVGNECVHPGTMDLKDDLKTAISLFDIINFLVDDRISRPKQLEELYQKLPHPKREAIVKRDARIKGTQ